MTLFSKMAETGLGKTNAAYLAMENSNAKQVLVLVPANGKETWDIEANVAFINPKQAHIIKGSADLPQAADSGKKYVVLSQQLLQDCESDPNLMAQIEETIIHRLKTDGLIIDEIDNFSNPGTISAQAAVRLASLIRQNYKEKTGSEKSPVIGLTATPIGGALSNMNVPMAILYPEDYVPSHNQSTEQKKTFSDTHLNRPDLVYSSLIGEKRMYRWEQATGVQEFRYDPLHIEASPFEEYLCYFIADNVETGALNKIRLLEDALLNPLLVKVEVRALAQENIPQFDIDETLEELKILVSEWKKFRGVDEPQGEEDYLNADLLIKLGKGDLVLSCFFSDLLEDGIDTLVEELTQGSDNQDILELRKFWQSRELSTKYQILRERIVNALEWQRLPDGRIVRKKVSIVSPSKRQGRTGDVLQRSIKSGDGTESKLYASYELDRINDTKLLKLVKNLVSEKKLCNPENVLMIDGTVNVGRPRNEIISRWVNNPDDAVMISTLEATYQSRDYTLSNLVDSQGREIVGVEETHLGPPWHYRQIKQRAGRQQRQGQLVPLDTTVLEVQDLLDQGKGEAVVYTYLLQRMALSGIVLSPEDQAFFDSKRLGNRIELQSKDARYLRDALSVMTGAGEERLIDLFESNLVSPEKFAEKFYDEAQDEYHITGYNADLVSQLVKHTTSENSKVLSLGAGTLLLQRKLQRGIDNLDINPFIMQQGWEKAKEFGGRTIQGRASSLDTQKFPDNTYDFVDLAFTLHMSRLTNGTKKVSDSERVKILEQVNRVLKHGGRFSLTTQEKTFDEEKFQRFTDAMEKYFGFRVEPEYSGWSFGLGKPKVRKRLGWSIFMTKVGEVNLEGLNIAELELLTDSRTWRSEWPKTRKEKSTMVPKDYPVAGLKINLDEFEIVNPNNFGEKVLISDVTALEHVLVDESETLEPELIIPDDLLVPTDNVSLNFLRGVSKQDHREYRKNLIRPIARATGWNWSQIEQFCIAKMQELSDQRRFTTSRLSMYSILTREAKLHFPNKDREVIY